MGIPPFEGKYFLPNGEHKCTLEDIEQTFLTSTQRARVWSLFSALLERLTSLGLQPDSLLIDGSFVTGRESPGDVDACALITPKTAMAALANVTDEYDLNAVRVLTTPLPQHERIVRTMYGAHLLIARNEAELQKWSKFFRRGKHGKLKDPDPTQDPGWVKTPAAKGILRIDFTQETR